MPRKPKRHVNSKRAIHNQKPNPERETKRIAARIQFLQQMTKEREIGIDPIHLHSLKRSFFIPRDAWLKKSREYEERNWA